MMRTIYSIILVLFASLSVWAEKYPHILVKDEDKVAVLDKIEKQAWAKHIFNQTKERMLSMWKGIRQNRIGFWTAI